MFGFGYTNHHHNSDRIGWRYIESKDQIELLLYSYNNKEVIKKHLAYVDFNKEIILGLTIVKDQYVNERNVIVYLSYNDRFKHFNYTYYSPDNILDYSLGWYFGGNKTAPHVINIQEF